MELGWCCLAIDVLILGAFLAPIALGIIETVLGIRARKRRRVIVGGLLCASSVVLAVLVLARPVQSLRLCIQAPYLSPPATFEDEDLVGTWRAVKAKLIFLKTANLEFPSSNVRLMS